MGSDGAMLIEVPIGPGLGPSNPPGIFPPGPPSSLGVGGAGAPGQGWGRGPTPKGLALDLGWPPLGWLAGRAWGVA